MKFTLSPEIIFNFRILVRSFFYNIDWSWELKIKSFFYHFLFIVLIVYPYARPQSYGIRTAKTILL